MTVDSLANEIHRLHALCDASRANSEETRPRWTGWFNMLWSCAAMLFALLFLVLVTKCSPAVAGVLVWAALPLAGLGSLHMLISTVIEMTFVVYSIREDNKPFTRAESMRLSDLIREEIEISAIDSDVVDQVIAMQELVALSLQAHLNWLKGGVVGCLAGIATLLFQGSVLRSTLMQWMNSSTNAFLQGLMLLGFLMGLATYMALWRRIVRCENRARFLKYIRDRRSFLSSISSSGSA